MKVVEATNFKTPIEHLYPKISDEGKELFQQGIEKYSAAKSVFYQVAELVKTEVEKWTTTTGKNPTYGQIRRHLLANDLVKELGKMRTDPAGFAFNAARADIQGDLEYQQRMKNWENTAKERLNLNPELEIPTYVSRPNFHWSPYIATNDWEEQFLGCVWDIGTSIMGQSSPTVRSYSLGGGRLSRMVNYLSERFPNFKPRRILDMGCSAGGSTIAMAIEFPDAEVHGIDISSSMLRCGHAVSVALDLPIYYHQMDASHTTFGDGSFDLIVSNIVFHELPNGIRRKVILECSRLLSPGGIMAHMEGGTYMSPTNIFQKLWRELDIHGNNEWYVGNASMEKLATYVEEAGLSTQGSLLQKITPSSEFFEGALLIGGQKI
ncbi:class I SAM-dependent methyltransferase [Crocosphaera chwakensis]|uniref:Methyltransferase type 12 n=1 Tax=Crocosphaera chwakensis CCY0110 TaxID=391612 RepID=A3IQ96_9CHRO|nr:class I SAM-dependent methyltransferase [Crocosphaera chwakensis]EAZ91436.1 Methyltransferase type 12 [Crocosphaera chwakensis CCY0110]